MCKYMHVPNSVHVLDYIPYFPSVKNSLLQAVESLEKEIKILKNVKHDRIVQYYGTQRNKECVCIFMEYMEGVRVLFAHFEHCF